MAIIATFTEGLTSVTVNGLHQWDYGQTLEIHDKTLPALVEVHFGYMGAREAVVRSCSAVNGVASVSIPDACLEQPAAVMAWVYEVGATTGRTIRTVVLPLVPRTRPAAYTGELTEEVSNKYTEAVAAMNEAVNEIQMGAICVSEAMNASMAYADAEGNAIHETYVRKGEAKALTWKSASTEAPPNKCSMLMRIKSVTPYIGVNLESFAPCIGKIVYVPMCDDKWDSEYRCDHVLVGVSDEGVFFLQEENTGWTLTLRKWDGTSNGAFVFLEYDYAVLDTYTFSSN